MSISFVSLFPCGRKSVSVRELLSVSLCLSVLADSYSLLSYPLGTWFDLSYFTYTRNLLSPLFGLCHLDLVKVICSTGRREIMSLPFGLLCHLDLIRAVSRTSWCEIRV